MCSRRGPRRGRRERDRPWTLRSLNYLPPTPSTPPPPCPAAATKVTASCCCCCRQGICAERGQTRSLDTTTLPLDRLPACQRSRTSRHPSSLPSSSSLLPSSLLPLLPSSLPPQCGDSRCEVCDAKADYCTQCKAGWGLDGTGECKPCENSLCARCDGGDCQECVAAYIRRRSPNSVSKSPVYQDDSGECTKW